MKNLTLFFVLLGFSLVSMAQTYNVTFKVNMNEVAEPFTTPEVNGNFNGWCGGCAPMSDPDLDGIWEVTIALAPGTYEYKFAYDSWAGQENLVPGTSCTVTNFGFTNRSLVVDAADIVMDPVCWASCDDCGAGSLYDITFQVNMNGVAGPFTTPEVNGNFNGWCGGCAPMSDADGDGIWAITITLAPGTYEYKFAYDAWTGQEALTEGDPCTVTNFGFTNRSLSVTDNATLDPVIWGTCDFINTNITPSGTVTVCSGTSQMFSAPTGYTGYQWKKNGITIPGATSSTYTTNQAGNYSVVISQGTAFAQSTASTLAVSKAAPKITPVGSLDICATGSVLLKGKIGVGSTYQWSKNGVPIVGAPLNYTATSVGNYKLKETTPAGCVKSKTATVTSSCKMDMSENDNISIYPNPNNGDFTIQLGENVITSNELNIVIYSSTGAIVFESNNTVENGAFNQNINLGNTLASGMYMVKINSGNTSITKTLVIE
jgi:hypothetical protein